MTRAVGLCLALVLVWDAHSSSARQQFTPTTTPGLVSTWTLSTFEQGVSGGQPVRVTNPRGLLVFDAAGHAFELVTSLAGQRTTGGQLPTGEAQATFAGYSGFWGGYRVDAARKTITYRPEGAVSPQMMGGKEFSRGMELDADRLIITSIAEPHTPAGTRWVWERVPTIENLSPLYRQVTGFWLHIIEKRMNPTTGVAATETKRAPSVIVYTPAGFVGVHFPPLNRQPFASDTPTPEEAQSALRGYIGYYGVLTVYPGQVFHNILAGVSPASGTILRRSAVISGEELTVQLPTTRNQQGQEAATVVTLKRLSGVAEMLPR